MFTAVSLVCGHKGFPPWKVAALETQDGDNKIIGQVCRRLTQLLAKFPSKSVSGV